MRMIVCRKSLLVHPESEDECTVCRCIGTPAPGGFYSLKGDSLACICGLVTPSVKKGGVANAKSGVGRPAARKSAKTVCRKAAVTKVTNRRRAVSKEHRS